jgi:glycosyltransferase involved in cell wall biosynthesis
VTNPDTGPRVAVLVACHDDGATVRETIDSLRSEQGIEFVVVDDGSTDAATHEELQRAEDKGIRVLRKENGGPSSAWMAGVEATTAPYVMPFSSDDVLLSGSTRLLADALDSDPDAGFAWGDIVTFGLANAYRPSVPALCPWLVTYMNAMPAYSLFRRTALLEVGGWAETTASEDWDLWMRLAGTGIAGVYVPQPIYRYRRGVGGRFNRRGTRHEGFYAELRERNAGLFAERASNRRVSPAPEALKTLLPLLDRVPGLPRLRKIQLFEALTLVCWSGGPRRTTRILAEGVAFRVRVLLRRPSARNSLEEQ